MVTVILGLLVFSVLVICHELGHFWVARRLGIRVERFSVGFGPVVFSRVRDGVQYAVSAFPLGGYVKMGGDDPRQRENLRPGDFFASAWWRRVLVALAGPGANFVVAIVLSIALMWVGVRLPDAPNLVGGVTAGSAADSLGLAAGDRVTALDGVEVGSLQAIYDRLGTVLEAGAADDPVELRVDREGVVHTFVLPRARLLDAVQGLEFPIAAQVGEVITATPAYKAGLSAGDRILAIDGETIENWSDMTRRITASPGVEIILTIQRGDRTLDLPITPLSETMDGETVGRIGIAPASPDTYLIRFGFTDGIVQGTRGALDMVGRTLGGIVSVFSSPSNLTQLSGPVAIIQASGDAAKAGWDRLLNFGVLISVALMVFNLLPIPILDGGMVFLSVLEAVRGRPVGDKGLMIYQGIGMAVLGTLLVFVLINDPLRILQRRSALGRIENIVP